MGLYFHVSFSVCGVEGLACRACALCCLQAWFWGWPQARTPLISPHRFTAVAQPWLRLWFAFCLPTCLHGFRGVRGRAPRRCLVPSKVLPPSQSRLPFEMEIFCPDAAFSRLPESRKPSPVSVFLSATDSSGLIAATFNREMRISHTAQVQPRWGGELCVGHPEIRESPSPESSALGTDSFFFTSWGSPEVCPIIEDRMGWDRMGREGMGGLLPSAPLLRLPQAPEAPEKGFL